MLKHDIIRLLDSFVSINFDNKDNNKIYVEPLTKKAYLEVCDNEMHIIDILSKEKTVYKVRDLHDIIDVWGELLEVNQVC
jgi:hypothetical protein